VLHVALGGVEDPWRRRLVAAHREGHRPVVACLRDDIASVDTLAFLQQIDATIALVDPERPGAETCTSYESVADLVARLDLVLDSGGLSSLGLARLDQALNADTSDRKGKYFEDVLRLMFSQVSYFQVVESRYRTATEEIDIVLGNRAVGHVAHLINGAFVVVSAKNQADAVGAPEVRALWGNMVKRRGRCQLGILCSARRIAQTAQSERTHATTDPTLAVALLDGRAIRDLLNASDLDGALERRLREAVLD
jgi:hypothetical protein